MMDEEYINQLKIAVQSGVTKIQYKDRMEEFRSLSDMLKIIRMSDPNFGLTKSSRTRAVRPIYSRGYQS